MQQWFVHRLINSLLIIGIIGIGFHIIGANYVSESTETALFRTAAPESAARPEDDYQKLSMLFQGANHTIASLTPQSRNRWVSQWYGMELKGTVAGELAVVQDLTSDQERVLHMGERLGDATITSIHRNRIVLEGSAGREELILPSDARTFDTSSESSGDLRVIPRKDLQKLTERLDRLAEEITLQPMQDADGDLLGYQITMLRPQGLLARMGLRKNDILRNVNSQNLSTMEDVYRVLEEAIHDTEIRLSISRNSHDMQLAYQIQ